MRAVWLAEPARAAALLALWSMLVPAALAVAGPSSSLGASSHKLPGEEDYASEHLSGRLRVCPGTVWPASSEKLLMPLMAANRENFKGKTVLDIDTGSGILALYAARLGAAKVVATDVEPRAIECTRENARRLGLDSLIETRLAKRSDSSAFSAIRTGEAFDVILSAQNSTINRHAVGVSGAGSVPPDDTIRYSFSIVNGLRDHLSRTGAAILGYRFAGLQTLVVHYARHSGFVVEHHPAEKIPLADFRELYNALVARVAKTERVEPDFLTLPETKSTGGWRSDSDTGAFVKVDYSAGSFGELTRMWDHDMDRVLAGTIVIRKQAPRPAPTEPKAPGHN